MVTIVKRRQDVFSFFNIIKKFSHSGVVRTGEEKYRRQSDSGSPKIRLPSSLNVYFLLRKQTMLLHPFPAVDRNLQTLRTYYFQGTVSPFREYSFLTTQGLRLPRVIYSHFLDPMVRTNLVDGNVGTTRCMEVGEGRG